MSEQRLKVLMVDDEPRVLDGLRRQLRVHRQKWDIRFAESGRAALAMLAEDPADVVVTDMRMPAMTGGQLLRQVRSLYPQTTRVILSGQTDQDALLADLGCIHTFLQKPCDAAVICAAIERTHLLSARLRQPRLRVAANRVISLPTGNGAYQSLVDELARPEPDLTRVGRIVSGDPAMTAKLMQLVNSAFFGFPRRTSTALEAVMLLGLKTINGVVVTARIFDYIADTEQNELITSLWQASLRIGESAGRYAEVDGADAVTREKARLAGVLCLVGRAILISSEPAAYANILNAKRATGESLDRLELREFGATQDEVGAYALGTWAFDDDIVDAVARQRERPEGSMPGSPLRAYLSHARRAHQPSAVGLDEPPPVDLRLLTTGDDCDGERLTNRMAA